MKRTFKAYTICWAILLTAFNLAAFITPNEMAGYSKFGGAFWVGYSFITIAFVGQLICAYFAFRQGNAQKFFYRVPLITISCAATVVSVVGGILCMVIPNIPEWVGAIVCLLILAFSAVSVMRANAAADIVETEDEKVKAKTAFIKLLTVDAEHLMAIAQSDAVRTTAKKVYEAARYSDPMSNPALTETEAEIEHKFAEFSKAVAADDADLTQEVSQELLNFMDCRNKKCRMLK